MIVAELASVGCCPSRDRHDDAMVLETVGGSWAGRSLESCLLQLDEFDNFEQRGAFSHVRPGEVRMSTTCKISRPPKSWSRGRAPGLDVRCCLHARHLRLVMAISASSHYSLKIYDHQWAFGVRQLAGLILVQVRALRFVDAMEVVHQASRADVRGQSRSAGARSVPAGYAAKGAPRWLRVGPFNIQPSEFAKIALAMVLLTTCRVLLGTSVMSPASWCPRWWPTCCRCWPSSTQRDLGSMALLVGIAGVAFFVAGLEWRWWCLVLAALVAW